MATRKLTALQIFKETKRINAALNKLSKDRDSLRKKIIAEKGKHYNEKLVVNGVLYELNWNTFGDVDIKEICTLEEINNLA
jgi:hypothetical protein